MRRKVMESSPEPDWNRAESQAFERDAEAIARAKVDAFREFAIEVENLLKKAGIPERQLISVYEGILRAAKVLIDRYEAAEATIWELVSSLIAEHGIKK
jgi:hypothetical protein